MNVLVSLSPTPMAHPPRSNPFLRSSSDAPPFPCITPSTVTCVVVVSFMIAVPFSLGRPSWAASHPCYEQLCLDPTPPPGFLSRTFWYAGCKRSGSATVSGRLRSTSSCAPSSDELWDQIDREAPDSSSFYAAVSAVAPSDDDRGVLPLVWCTVGGWRSGMVMGTRRSPRTPGSRRPRCSAAGSGLGQAVVCC